MDKQNFRNESEVGQQPGRMPDFPFNRSWAVGAHTSENEAVDDTTKATWQKSSRRGFLAGAAAAGLGVAGMTSSVGANDYEDEDTMAAGGSVKSADENEEGEIEDGARIVHLSPDAPVVDVYVDGELWFEDVEPFATQTEYLKYVPGTYTVQFAPAGEGQDAAVLEDEVTFEEGRYTVAAVGEACAVSDEPLRIVNLEDDISQTTEGHARVRGVHASPDAPAVDFTTSDGETVFENLGFGEGEYGEIPANEEVIEIRECASGSVIERFEIGFEAGHVYTVFAVGYVDSDNAPRDAVENASLRIGITEDATPGER